MENTVFNVFALEEAKKCRKAYLLNEYRLNYHGGKESARSVIFRALSVVKAGFFEKDKTLDAVRKEVQDVLMAYPAPEGELNATVEQDREKAERKVMRAAEYLWKYKNLAGSKRDVRFSYSIGEATISDKADLLLFPKEGETIAIRFVNDVSPYSDRARKPENRPEKSIGIAALCVGLSSSYEGKFTAEEWYLTGKDDKGMELPAFEFRPGKNITRAIVTPSDAEEVLAKALSCVYTAHVGDCDNCRHAVACRLVSIRDDASGEAESSGKRPEPKFTQQQQCVVDHGKGPMVVLAVPGAGKTTVLVHRLLKLLRDGVPAENILFVTFTRKAAGEIRERVRALVDGALPNIFTFNAFGYTLLKANPTLLGRRVRLAKETDKKAMVRECLNEAPLLNGMGYGGAFMDFGIINRVYKWFEDIDEMGVDAFRNAQEGKVKDMEGVINLYALYKSKFKASGCLSYDEQISLVCELFKKYPAFLKKCGERYRYIMVDEFQDTDDEQAQMIYQLAREHGNLVVVGDDDQSIYEWRGGTNKYLLNFADDFIGAEVIVMNDNFRSNNQILAAADSVIAVNEERYQKQIQGHREARFAPVFYKNSDADKIAALIPQLRASYDAGDIAVIARTNKRLVEVEDALNGVVKTATPKDYLVEDAVFEIVYDLLTLYLNLADDVALYRMLCRLGAGRSIPRKKSSSDSLYETIRSMEPVFNLDRLSVEALPMYAAAEKTPLLTAGCTILKVIKKMQYFQSFGALFEDIADLLCISPTHKVFGLLQEEADERAFVRLRDLYRLMTDMRLFKDTIRVGYEPCRDAVNLLTAHDSKGKEFPVVILYATEDFDTSEEGNRLLYVAMTRAKNTLIMLQSPFCEGCKALPVMAEHVTVR